MELIGGELDGVFGLLTSREGTRLLGISGQPETKRVCWGPLGTRKDARYTGNILQVVVVGPELEIITRAL